MIEPLPQYIPCANCCSKCCHGIDLPDSLTATFLDDDGTLPCLNNYSINLLNRTLAPGAPMGQVVEPAWFFPIRSGWGQFTNVRNSWHYIHWGKHAEFKSYRRWVQLNPYDIENDYWDDASLDLSSIPYWASVFADASPHPPRNQGTWQIGNCIGQALYDQSLSGVYAPIPSTTAYSRTAVNLEISCTSNYSHSNPAINMQTYRTIGVVCEIQMPAYLLNPREDYRFFKIVTNQLYVNEIISLTCEPFLLEFSLNIPEYWSYTNVLGETTRSTIGATGAGVIRVVVTE